jgi:hypothetical protein
MRDNDEESRNRKWKRPVPTEPLNMLIIESCRQFDKLHREMNGQKAGSNELHSVRVGERIVSSVHRDSGRDVVRRAESESLVWFFTSKS